MNDKPAPLALGFSRKEIYSLRVWHEIGADRTSVRALAEGRPPERGRSGEKDAKPQLWSRACDNRNLRISKIKKTGVGEVGKAEQQPPV